MTTGSQSRFPLLRLTIHWARWVIVFDSILVAVASGALVYHFVPPWLGIEGGFLAILVAVTGLCAGLTCYALCDVLLGLAGVGMKIESSAFRSHDQLLELGEQVGKHTRLLQSIAEHTQLSEVARGIAYRERERELIRRAFNETLIGGDYEAAHFLADQLERRHGYRQEAERLRREIETARNEFAHRQISDAVLAVEEMFSAQQWERARTEIDRLQKAFPNDPKISRLPERMRQRYADHKRRLLKEWDEVVQRNAIDRGIEVIKQLDAYLSPNEAAALQESARGVFRAKLHNLGVQFSLAAHDGQWTEALEIGLQIIDEFPNSRMAAEVRDRLDTLRSRAARALKREQSPAEV